MQFNLFRKLLFLAVLGSVIVFSSSPSFAQIGIPENPNEHISQFISEVSIRNDGSIKVRETISYDFGFESRRGIFRYIPYKYPYDGAKPKDAVDGSKYSRVTAFKLEKVFRDGSKDKNKVTEENSNKVIRIGEEDKYLNGKHTYIISYTLNNFINEFQDHDELYFNVNGLGWDVPIEKTKVTISIEGADSGTVLTSTCFAGPQNSNLPCENIESTEDGLVELSHGSLGAYSGVTAVVGIPKGILNPEPINLQEDFTIGSAFRITP
ncbi:MAG TPA: DUF2207 domain-containing protein, partial [Acidimicrobiia bacterium]|nr:DUF2207 domain-containing protein [Acidimicrobiia bacterium]